VITRNRVTIIDKKKGRKNLVFSSRNGKKDSAFTSFSWELPRAWLLERVPRLASQLLV
jgi:hypothetical protein